MSQRKDKTSKLSGVRIVHLIFKPKFNVWLFADAQVSSLSHSNLHVEMSGSLAPFLEPPPPHPHSPPSSLF